MVAALGDIPGSGGEVLNLATKLSISRLFLSFIFLICLIPHALFWRVAALFFLILAVTTDIYDGRIARKGNEVTALGTLLDPLADKILVSFAFISFIGMEELSIPAPLVAVIVSREFLIMGLRLMACGVNKILPAEKEGKQKTVLQMGAAVIILIYLIVKTRATSSGLWNQELEVAGAIGTNFIMSFTMIFTVFSGYAYLKRHKDIFLK